MDEATLQMVVARAANEDAEALGELYRLFRPRVFGLCRHVLGRREEAEDATGDLFARLSKALKSYQPSLPFPRWLLSVTSHHCVDRLRRRRLEQRLFEAEISQTQAAPAPQPLPLEQMIASESRETVSKAIAGLPDHYRVPLTLRYYSELSYDEIAEQLGLTRAHVATLLFRAKQQLRQMLGARPPGWR